MILEDRIIPMLMHGYYALMNLYGTLEDRNPGGSYSRARSLPWRNPAAWGSTAGRGGRGGRGAAAAWEPLIYVLLSPWYLTVFNNQMDSRPYKIVRSFDPILC